VTTCLLDVQIATLANQASSYLATQRNPQRMGNAHPSIVPYQSFQTADGLIAIGVGNDSQFRALCQVLNVMPLARDGSFRDQLRASRASRDTHSPAAKCLHASSSRHWITQLTAAGVPAGPVNTLAEVFADPHVVQRELQISMPHTALGSVPGVACPVRLSDSPPRTDRGRRLWMSTASRSGVSGWCRNAIEPRLRADALTISNQVVDPSTSPKLAGFSHGLLPASSAADTEPSTSLAIASRLAVAPSNAAQFL
jgi:crotonobetainyl-CoA:carnitine CoA-transferase CaiB-like acyl-CoA transferase